MTRSLVGSAILAAVFLAIAGCGGGNESAPTAKQPAPVATTPSAAAPTTTVAGEAEEETAPLLAWADASPEDGKAPLTVEFKADTEGGKPPLKYTWKFGDGTPDSNEANPKHTFNVPGKFRADLSVSDSGGDSDSDYIEIEVQ
ncbi:MAG TPA: PKD domain-containing protein [Candidatus Nitrosopolaris sp.]|nr:PKD domain-containing protein [Candidatus Nitrosopolaris sp.]